MLKTTGCPNKYSLKIVLQSHKKVIKSTECLHNKNANPVKTDIHRYVENYRMSKLK